MKWRPTWSSYRPTMDVIKLASSLWHFRVTYINCLDIRWWQSTKAKESTFIVAFFSIKDRLFSLSLSLFIFCFCNLFYVSCLYPICCNFLKCNSIALYNILIVVCFILLDIASKFRSRVIRQFGHVLRYSGRLNQDQQLTCMRKISSLVTNEPT